MTDAEFDAKERFCTRSVNRVTVVKERLASASCFALKHLGASALIASICAALVFGLWFPAPYSELAKGKNIFLLVMAVDLTIGPLLSLIVYDTRKSRRELWRDLGVVFALQFVALGYGLHSLGMARPVMLAFEGDRYRIVAMPDVEVAQLNVYPNAAERLSWTGPKLVGVRLLSNTDQGYVKSIQLAMQGVHPAFRPERWVDYETQSHEAIRQAKPLADLKRKHPTQVAMVDDAVRKLGLEEKELGYLPLAAEHNTDWSVVIDLKDGMPRLFLPLDAW